MSFLLHPLNERTNFRPGDLVMPPPPPVDGSAPYILYLHGKPDEFYFDPAEGTFCMREHSKHGTRGCLVRKVDDKILGFSGGPLETTKVAYTKARILQCARRPHAPVVQMEEQGALNPCVGDSTSPGCANSSNENP